VPVGTAFHERTLTLCESLNYREWSGYYAVSVYEMHHEHEYNAIRNSAALIDISPLFKYRVTGHDATKLKRASSRRRAPRGSLARMQRPGSRRSRRA
jgi:aminomethyltransferase